jgi:hypothetical protein
VAAFSHEAATSAHPTRVVITLTARGSKIAKLNHVKLKHCKWNLGKVGAKHFKGGKRIVRVVVARTHEATKGSVKFRVYNERGKYRLVKSRV